MKELALQLLHLLLANLPAVVVAALGGLFALVHLSDRRKRYIEIATRHGASLAADLESELLVDGDTKAAEAFDVVAHALKIADEYMVGHGFAKLSDAEKQAAAIHAQTLSPKGVLQ